MVRTLVSKREVRGSKLDKKRLMTIKGVRFSLSNLVSKFEGLEKKLEYTAALQVSGRIFQETPEKRVSEIFG